MTATKAAPAPSTYRSGWCSSGYHDRCRGTYAGVDCTCQHHEQPEPEPPVHVEPRQVQIRRGEVWRTDPDGSWQAIGIVERGDHATLDGAVTELLTGLGVDTDEYQP
jgi:hypothetical protein